MYLEANRKKQFRIINQLWPNCPKINQVREGKKERRGMPSLLSFLAPLSLGHFSSHSKKWRVGIKLLKMLIIMILLYYCRIEIIPDTVNGLSVSSFIRGGF